MDGGERGGVVVRGPGPARARVRESLFKRDFFFARARAAGRAGPNLSFITPARIAVAALASIVACAAIVVIAAADRPSVLSATTTANYFPHWMAGPLGGLWPWLTRDPTVLRYLLTGALVFMYAAYVLALRRSSLLRPRHAIAAIVAVHAILFLSPPLALTDIFNYVNYARMEVVHHLNPYTTTPILEPHSDPAFTLSNWHELLSPYGPLFTLMTFAVVPLGLAGSFWALKAILMAASLVVVLLVWKSARLLGRDPVAAIVFVGLNPIVLMWGLGGDHNDFLMMLFVLLGFYLLLRAGAMPGLLHDGESGETARGGEGSPAAVGRVDGRPPARRVRIEGRASALPVAAGVALMSAVALKASAGILVPIAMAPMARRGHWRQLGQLALGMALAGVALGAASVAAFGPHFPDLATQGRLVTMESLPNLLGLALLQGGETQWLQIALAGVLLVVVAACTVLAYRRREPLTGSGWATVALLVTLSWVLPWYVLWLLPFAVLAGSRRLRTTALVLGVYFIAVWAPVSGGILHGLGFHPDKTPLGRLHQRYVKELLY